MTREKVDDRDLREKAERLMAETWREETAPAPEPREETAGTGGGEGTGVDENLRLIHELRVHQVELEIQNQELQSAQRHLEKSRDRFYRLYHNAPAAYLTLDANGMILEANHTATRMMGVSAPRPLLRPFSGFILEWDLPLFLAQFPSLFRHSEGRQLEFRLKRADGAVIFVTMEARVATENEVSPDLEERGNLLLVTLTDITRLKHSETALRDSLEFTRTVLDSLGEHIAVLDPDGVILSVNEAWRRFASLNGAAEDASIGPGENYLEVCERAKGSHAEGAREVARGIREVIEGKRDRFTLEYPCHSPQERRFFQMWATPHEYQGGRGAIVAHIDISARRIAEEDLRESRALLRAYLDHLPAAVFVLDSQGRIIDANEAISSLWNRPKAEILGRTCEEFLDPKTAKSAEDAARRVLETGRPFSSEEVMEGVTGPRVFETLRFPLRNTSGRITAIAGVSFDRTRERALEERLLHVRKMEAIGSLSGGIAHEFNNILSIIIGNVELAQGDLPAWTARASNSNRS